MDDVCEEGDGDGDGAAASPDASDHDDDDIETGSEPEGLVSQLRRGGVSAEPAGAFNKRFTGWRPERSEKTAEMKAQCVAAFRSFPMLRNAEEGVLVELADAARIEAFEPGAAIVRAGEVGRCGYVLLQGTAEVWEFSARKHTSTRASMVGASMPGLRGAGGGGEPSPSASSSSSSAPPPQARAPGEEFRRSMRAVRFFGEHAMLWGFRRGASVYAKDHCVIGKITRDVYSNLVAQRAMDSRSVREGYLRRMRMFETLSVEEIAKIADALESRSYGAGDAVISQGHKGSEFFVVTKGECVATVMTGSASDTMNTLKTRRYQKGDRFGELSFISPSSVRAATVTAENDVEVLCLSRAKFERMLGPLDKLQQEHYIRDPRKTLSDFYRAGTEDGPCGACPVPVFFPSLDETHWLKPVNLRRLDPSGHPDRGVGDATHVVVGLESDAGRRLNGRKCAVGETEAPGGDAAKQQHRRARTDWFCVYRPTGQDAIEKMARGIAVGKGLNIKGKSSKKNHLSGFVPFLQISSDSHKANLEDSPPDARLTIYYQTQAARDSAVAVLEPLTRREAGLELEGPMTGCVRNDRYAESGIFGLDVHERVMREAYITQPSVAFLVGWETGRQSEPAFMNMNLHTIRSKSEPEVVLYQFDALNPMNPHGLLMAYAESTVKPVVSDFDTFTVGSRGMAYAPLPAEQQAIAHWSLDRSLEILRSPGTASWTSRWLDVLGQANEDGYHPAMPKYGWGDAVSTSLIKDVVQATEDSGAVRHGAECFNFGFPQELDSEYCLVVWDGFEEKPPWRYKDKHGLRDFLLQRIREGYTFPLNPVWPIRDEGWYEVYTELRNNEETRKGFQSFFPPQSGLVEKIDRIHEEHPRGFRCEAVGPPKPQFDHSDLDGREYMEFAAHACSRHWKTLRNVVNFIGFEHFKSVPAG